jgi:hypothetical protein
MFTNLNAGTLMSMIRSVSAMAKTPSQKASSRVLGCGSAMSSSVYAVADPVATIDACSSENYSIRVALQFDPCMTLPATRPEYGVEAAVKVI